MSQARAPWRITADDIAPPEREPEIIAATRFDREQLAIFETAATIRRIGRSLSRSEGAVVGNPIVVARRRMGADIVSLVSVPKGARGVVLDEHGDDLLVFWFVPAPPLGAWGLPVRAVIAGEDVDRTADTFDSTAAERARWAAAPRRPGSAKDAEGCHVTLPDGRRVLVLRAWGDMLGHSTTLEVRPEGARASQRVYLGEEFWDLVLEAPAPRTPTKDRRRGKKTVPV